MSVSAVIHRKREIRGGVRIQGRWRACGFMAWWRCISSCAGPKKPTPPFEMRRHRLFTVEQGRKSESCSEKSHIKLILGVLDLTCMPTSLASLTNQLPILSLTLRTVLVYSLFLSFTRVHSIERIFHLSFPVAERNNRPFEKPNQVQCDALSEP